MWNFIVGIILGAVAMLCFCEAALKNATIPTSGIITEISTKRTVIDSSWRYDPIPNASLGDTLITTLHKKAEVK